MNIVDLIRLGTANPQAAAKMAFQRGSEFAVGWNEGVKRYAASKGLDIVSASGLSPRETPTAYAASEAAVAYCIALERTR